MMAASPRIRNALTLFSSPDCVVCHRVRLVLAAKGASYELVPVDTANPPEDLLDLNPYHSVPTLDQTIAKIGADESRAPCHHDVEGRCTGHSGFSCGNDRGARFELNGLALEQTIDL